MNQTNSDKSVIVASVLFLLVVISWTVWMIPQHWKACGILYDNPVSQLSCFLSQL